MIFARVYGTPISRAKLGGNSPFTPREKWGEGGLAQAPPRTSQIEPDPGHSETGFPRLDELPRRVEIRVLPHLLLHFLPFLLVIEQDLAVAEMAALDAALGLAEQRLETLQWASR